MQIHFLKSGFVGVVAFVVGHGLAHADILDAQREAYGTSVSKAMLAENVDALVASFVDNGRLMPEFQETAIGPDQISQYYGAFFDRFDTTNFERKTDEVLELGNVTLEIGSFKTDIVVTQTSASMELSGTYFEVWEKQADGEFKLFSSAWNYDQAYEGVRQLMHFSYIESTPAQQIPGIPISDELSYEVLALNEFNDVLMKRQQPDKLKWIYAEDAAYAPHDAPMMRGRDAIAQFLKGYTAHWPPFDFVDVSVDRLIPTPDGAISYTSYNLRWIGQDMTNVSTGKAIRVWKRSKEGQLQSYRQIAMHDF